MTESRPDDGSTAREAGLRAVRFGTQRQLELLASASLRARRTSPVGKCVWFEITAGAAGPSASPSTTEVPDGPAA